jgi:hypothetical protein
MKLNNLIQYLKKFSKYNNKDSKKRVLIDILGAEVPNYIYVMILFTRAFNKLGYKIDYQVGNNTNLINLYKFNSYKMYIPKKKYILKYFFQICFLNIKNLYKYFNMKSIFDLYINDIYVGDLIYDEFNRQQAQPSIQKISLKYLIKINEAYFYYCYYNDLFKNNDYEYTFLNHNCYIRNGLIGRVANKRGSKTLLLTATDHDVLLRKLYEENEFKFYSILNKKIFQDTLNKKELVDKASSYFDSIMNQTLVTNDADNFKKSRTDTNEESLSILKKYKENGKKIVVISTHVLIDNIVGADGRKQIYRDIKIWLEETLKLCDKNENIIAFLKPHPREYAFDYQPKIMDIYNSLDLKNIKIWPDDVDMKDNYNLIDTILTIRGSVSLEFPCFGIPVILAGKDHAGSSGLDTVIEVDTVKEYEEIIANIHTIERLSVEKQNEAKMVYYMYYNSLFYKLDDSIYLSKTDFYKPEYLSLDKKELPSDIFFDDIQNKIISKIELSEENHSIDKIKNDIVEFLDREDLVTIGELQFRREFLDK